jgi:hypothetical protein
MCQQFQNSDSTEGVIREGRRRGGGWRRDMEGRKEEKEGG